MSRKQARRSCTEPNGVNEEQIRVGFEPPGLAGVVHCCEGPGSSFPGLDADRKFQDGGSIGSRMEVLKGSLAVLVIDYRRTRKV